MINEKIAYILLGIASVMFVLDLRIVLQKREFTWRIIVAIILFIIDFAMTGFIQEFTQGYNDGLQGK